jgi:hypothetical protein
MKRLFILAVIFLMASRAEAGPLDFFKHPIRTMQRHPVLTAFAFAGVAATVDGFGLRHCREGDVENCRAKYGAAYGSFGAATGANFAVIAATSGCWKDQNKAFCSIFSYGGSAVQLGFGINQFRKKGGEREKTDFLLPVHH